MAVAGPVMLQLRSDRICTQREMNRGGGGAGVGWGGGPCLGARREGGGRISTQNEDAMHPLLHAPPSTQPAAGSCSRAAAGQLLTSSGLSLLLHMLAGSPPLMGM